jgi:hypothetical protein
MKISSALLSLVPKARFGIEDNDWNKLQWIDERPCPPKEQVMAEVERLRLEWESKEYQRLRQPEYPPLADYVDAVYWQSKGDDRKMEAYIAAVEAVKQKFPK